MNSVWHSVDRNVTAPVENLKLLLPSNDFPQSGVNMPIEMSHVRLLVSDFPTAFKFYRDVVGLEPLGQNENDVYADFKAGPIYLGLFRQDLMAEAVGTESKPSQSNSQDKIAVIFSVGDVDETAEVLRSKGLVLETEPQDRAGWGLRTIHFRDPEGNLIEMYSALPETK
jgi:lactoylglutathione lyase